MTAEELFEGDSDLVDALTDGGTTCATHACFILDKQITIASHHLKEFSSYGEKPTFVCM